jgi:purine-nucleoside phosphorylase
MDSKLQAAVSLIKARISQVPDLAIVLGSGFQSILEQIQVKARIGFDELPGCQSPSVPGHEGAAILSTTMSGRSIILVSGRMHYYEGHSMETVTLPVRALGRSGVRTVLLTNAAGGIRPGMDVGDLMCLSDHINFIGLNPLRGALGVGGEGFIDLCGLYSDRLNKLVTKGAHEHGFAVHEGVYVGVSGPSFETPAEIRMFGQWGGDAVGMSTIPEAIAARQAGMEVGALSFITNLAAGRALGPIRHDDVIERLQSASGRLSGVLKSFCHGLDSPSR